MKTTHMTQEQYRAELAKKKKRSKYGNKKVIVDMISFDSMKEAKRYGLLKIRERAGEITDLELQPEFQVFINNKKIFSYFADFGYMEKGLRVIEDVKSEATRKNKAYRQKKKAVEAAYGIQIIEV